jgi:WD40 repeat protein
MDSAMARGASWGGAVVIVVTMVLGGSMAATVDGSGPGPGWAASSAGAGPSPSAAPKDFILLTAKPHAQAVRGVAWSPDASRYAVGDDAGAVSIYDTSSGNLLKTWAAHSSAIRTISWSGDGGLLATGSRDDTVRTWKTDKWEMAKEIKGVFDDDIEDVAWSPRLPSEGQALEMVIASKNGQIKRLNDQGKLLSIMNVSNPGSAQAVAVAWDPKGDLITGITTDGLDYTVYLWIATSGNIVPGSSPAVFTKRAFDITWGGPALIAVAFETGGVAFLDPANLAEKGNVSFGARALSVSFAPKGLAGQLNNLAVGGDDGTVRIVDSLKFGVIGNLSGLGSQVLNLAFSPNGTGSKLLAGGQSGVAALWGERAPRVVWTSPAEGGRNVSAGVEPVLKFDRPMDDSLLTTSTVSITGVGAVSVQVVNNTNNSVVRVLPATKLENDKDYTLTVTSGARSHPDLGGVALESDFTLRFRTEAAAPAGLNIPWLYVGAAVGGLFLIILIVLLLRRRRSGGGREVRVGRREGGGGGKGGDWES